MKNYYVYIHRRLTDNAVFYVGLGSQKNHLRAMTKHGRNRIWNNVVKKHGFNYEVLFDVLTFDEAKELEMFLITIYGRKDLGKGNLVNLTDGGEGTFNILKTKESIEKWKLANTNKQNGINNTMFGKTRGKHHLAKEVLDLETGIYYDCALDVSDVSGIIYSTLKSILNNKRVNKTRYIYACNYENKIPNKQIKSKSTNQIIKEEKRGCKKYILDTNTGVFYNSLKELSDLYKFNYSSLKSAMRYKNTQFIYA